MLSVGTVVIGVHDLPASAYEMSGKRMAAQGYMRSGSVPRKSLK